MRRPPTLLLLTLTALLAPMARALDWKSQVFEATAAPFQATVDAVFEFKNSGPKPVTVLAVESTCDCVTAANEHGTYGPGASGRIQATFTIGDRVGLYERAVYVKTDEGAADPVRLVLRVTVPDLVEITPRMVFWRTNGKPAEQIVEIKVTAAVSLHLDDVQSMTQSFAARLETVTAGKHYRLHVKPRDTAQPISDALRIRGATADGRALIFSAYAYVK